MPTRVLLHDITLQFKPGKVYGLIGHNGSGKSTLLKLLSRQNQPSSGAVLLEGRPVAGYSARNYAKQVAYLPQHLPAATALTARELINMGRYAWSGLLGRSSEADRAAVAEAFALTHTEKFADQIVDTLSGGERSRIWLAMCLAQQSRFLLLDEPLAALDIAHQLDVMALIRDLSHRLDLGVIIVIHDINLAAQYCDELVALKGGKLLKQGTPAEIMTAEVLNDIYSVEMNIIRHPQSGVPVALP
ncbi:MAG: ATP-binding cassette domain-containing protein [Neisseria sp.]|nr:ATP-binding cassette domain-containing protein [Neisseria sp.]